MADVHEPKVRSYNMSLSPFLRGLSPDRPPFFRPVGRQAEEMRLLTKGIDHTKFKDSVLGRYRRVGNSRILEGYSMTDIDNASLKQYRQLFFGKAYSSLAYFRR